MYPTCGEISARIELANLFCPQALAFESFEDYFFFLEQVTSLLQSCSLGVSGFFFSGFLFNYTAYHG